MQPKMCLTMTELKYNLLCAGLALCKASYDLATLKSDKPDKPENRIAEKNSRKSLQEN